MAPKRPMDSLEQQTAGHMTQAVPRPSVTEARLTALDDVIAKGMANKPGSGIRRRGAGGGGAAGAGGGGFRGAGHAGQLRGVAVAERAVAR